jgi:hypothetical protein
LNYVPAIPLELQYKNSAELLIPQPGVTYTFKQINDQPGQWSPQPPKPGQKTDVKIETQNSEPNSTNFSVTLPNGVTVELCDVSNYPQNSKAWRPDGSDLQNPPLFIKPTPNGRKENVGFAIKVKGPQDLSISYGPVEGSSGHSGSTNVINKDGEKLEGYNSLTALITDEQTSTSITLGISTSPWETLATHTGKGPTTTGGKMIIFSQAFETKNSVAITVSAKGDKTRAERVVAIDNEGQTHTPQGQSSLGSNDLDQITVEFDGMQLKDIKEFQFQIRPYERVTFKNISIRPGQKTDVKVEILPTQNDAAKENSAAKAAATLEFRVVPEIEKDINEQTLKKYKETLETEGPDGNCDGYKWVIINSPDKTSLGNSLLSHRYKDTVYVLLCDQPDKRMLADGTWGLQKVSAETAGQPGLTILTEFDDTGAARFEMLTKQNIGQRIAIVINAKAISAPRVQSVISKQAAITGNFTNEEVANLVQALIKGMPPLGTTQIPRQEASQNQAAGLDIVPTNFDLRFNSKSKVYSLGVFISNQSSSVLPKMKLRFYRGNLKENLDETGNPQRTWHEAGPIAPGKTWNECTGDFYLPDGQYEFHAVLDFENAIAETDETNNAVSLNVKISDGRIVEKSKTYTQRANAAISDSGKETDVKIEIQEPQNKTGQQVEAKVEDSGWRRRFDEIYHLKDGQIVKRIAPPFIPERDTYYKQERSDLAQAEPESPDYFIFHWDGNLKYWGFGYKGGHNILSGVIQHSLGIRYDEFEGSEELLKTEVPGDWIIRQSSSAEDKLLALEEILKEEMEKKIHFLKRTVDREVIVARGQFHFQPPNGTYKNEQILFYSDILDPDERVTIKSTINSVEDLLNILGNLTGISVVNDTKSVEAINMPYGRHQSSYIRTIKNPTEKTKRLKLLLENLSKQTNLEFRTEVRPVEKWFVVEGDTIPEDILRPGQKTDVKIEILPTQNDMTKKNSAALLQKQ